MAAEGPVERCVLRGPKGILVGTDTGRPPQWRGRTYGPLRPPRVDPESGRAPPGRVPRRCLILLVPLRTVTGEGRGRAPVDKGRIESVRRVQTGVFCASHVGTPGQWHGVGGLFLSFFGRETKIVIFFFPTEDERFLYVRPTTVFQDLLLFPFFI